MARFHGKHGVDAWRSSKIDPGRADFVQISGSIWRALTPVRQERSKLTVGMSFAPSLLLWFVGSKQYSRWNISVDFDTTVISHTLEHRGCGIRAASYEISPQSWLPEACVWLHTEFGNRKIWVHSFAHCFAAEELRFSNRLEADSWALSAAKAIIDRAMETSQLRAFRRSVRSAPRLFRLLGVARYSISKLKRFSRQRAPY
jgi:hypothetical protein